MDVIIEPVAEEAPGRGTGRTAVPAFALASTVLAPLLFLTGQALLPVSPDDLNGAYAVMLAHPDQFLASRLLTAAGAFLFVPALWSVLALLPARSRGSRMVTVSAFVMAVGTFSNALSQAVEGYTMHALFAAPIDVAGGRAAMGNLGEGMIGLPISFWSIPLFGLGMIGLGAGLLVSRRLPAWQPVLLIVGALLGAATAGMGYVVALTELPMLLAWIFLAQTIRRRRVS